ncbi:gasdermin-E isoform X1 [Paramisgurnus dabryanus]|uniref:gasdermin-E isoform X1 n=1 Tax=Paramisgurnus dabryanus TaxID=90735 RepID=UPI0031F436DB
MFESATKKLVRQIDPNGVLIATSSPNDSNKLRPLAVVLKKPKKWFWQETTYRPTSFTLNDLLKEKEIKPVLEKNEFLKYEATYKNAISGSVEVGNKVAGVKGQGRSKLHVSFGTLQKEDVDIPILLKDSRERKVDLEHSLIQQSLKWKKVFTLLKERILTTCECSISYVGLEQGSCFTGFGGFSEGSCFSALGGFSEMFIKDSGQIRIDSDLVLTIPPGTIMAYSVMEMSIDSNGNFELSLGPDGIEADDNSQDSDCSETDGPWPFEEIPKGSALSSLNKALSDVHNRLYSLTDLSCECRSSLLLHLSEILLDRPILSALVDRLEEPNSEEAPFLPKNELTDKQRLLTDTFLDLLKCEQFKSRIREASVANQNGSQTSTANHSGHPSASELNGSEKQNGERAVSHHNGTSTKSSKQSDQLRVAMHMLLSALEELTDAGLKLLGHFCSPEGLRSLQDFVNLLVANDTPLSKDSIPVFLQKDEEFSRVKVLFNLCNVLLKEEDNVLFAEVTCEEGFLPLVLCIVINGLACLIGE